MFRITQFWMFFTLVGTLSNGLSAVFADDIDSDYFFGSSYEALRARDALDCKNAVNVLYCKHKCKNDAGVCFEGKCYCVYEPKPDLPKKSAIIADVDYPEDVMLKYSPVRRHHIAHFCPNLEEARKCIRKCMKEGKPAFCGKDHVCYCGHRYSQHQKKDKLDPAKINAGFYDLYMKYFGPEVTIMEPHLQKKKKYRPKKVDHASSEEGTEEEHSDEGQKKSEKGDSKNKGSESKENDDDKADENSQEQNDDEPGDKNEEETEKKDEEGAEAEEPTDAENATEEPVPENVDEAPGADNNDEEQAGGKDEEQPGEQAGEQPGEQAEEQAGDPAAPDARRRYLRRLQYKLSP